MNTNETVNATYPGNFVFAVGTVGQVTNVIMNLINIFISFGGNPKNRIPYTLVLCAIVILFHVAMAIVDSQAWPFTFFILCLVSVFLMYVATGIMNSCIYYVASMFPMEYVNAIIVGNVNMILKYRSNKYRDQFGHTPIFGLLKRLTN